MIRRHLLLCAALLATPLVAAENRFIGASPPSAAPAPSPLSPEQQRATFSLPPDFEIELVASDPDVAKVVTVAFDEAGRMWAVTAVEYPVDENEDAARARALFAGDGRDRVLVFDQPTAVGPQHPRTFAEGLAIPLGILPYRDGAFVGHGDKVLFLRDSDGDGKADKREVVLSGFGIQDSHLFPHQFTRAPGDWFYLAQGAFNYSKVKDAAGRTTEFNQTKMARFRADGSSFETVCWGPNNIWGFVITRGGDMFIQEANDLGYPVMPFFIGAAYPGIGMHKPKPYAPFQPPLADFHMGGTGLSGLALAEDRDGFPAPYRGVMYLANPITRMIQAIRIDHDGADYKLTKLPDFILSSDEWFRPVAIHFGPDSCLYIVDWYNKIISHNEVARDHPDRDKTHGRIWRVRHKSTPRRAPVDLTRVPDEELLSRLNTANTWEARAARHQIIDRKAAALADSLRRLTTASDTSPELLLNALWTLEGLGKVELPDLKRLAAHSHYSIRREAVRIAAAQPVAQEFIALLESLRDDPHPQVRAEVVRSIDQLAQGTNLAPRFEAALLELLLNMAKPPLDGPTVKTEQGGEIVKTGAGSHRDFERYLIRAALEKHAGILDGLLGRMPTELSIESRLFAFLALPGDKAARRVAELWPKANRPLNDEELALLAQQTSDPLVSAVFTNTLEKPAYRKRYLMSLLKIRDRLDASTISQALAGPVRLQLNGEPQDDLWLKVATAFRLANLEPELLAYAARTNLSSEQKIAVLRALREVGANQPLLFQQWALASKPGEPLQREAMLALAACNDAVPRLIEMWPVLSAPVRRLVLDKLAGSKPSARAWLQAVARGDLAKKELDVPLLDKLRAVLGDDPILTELRKTLAPPLRPVLRLRGKNADYVDYKVDLDGPFTVEAWIKLDPDISNRDGLLGAPGVADFNFHDARPRVWDSEKHDVIIARKQVLAEVWTHVAISRDAQGRFKIFINGELDNDQCTPTSRAYRGVYVCRTSNPEPGGPAALVSEYRIWNTARGDNEIRAFYRTTFEAGPRPSGLVHYFSGSRWSHLHGSAQVIQASDHPPLIDQETARKQEQKFNTFREFADKPGDTAQGKVLFKGLCAACHNVNGEGGQIGPSLSGAGAMGIEGLLHSMLTPNEAVESGYYVFRVETKDEEVLDGFLVKQDEQSISLRQPNSEDKRIGRENVKRASFARTSMMPEGLLEGIKPDDVSNLFAYLKTLK